MDIYIAIFRVKTTQGLLLGSNKSISGTKNLERRESLVSSSDALEL